MKQYIIYFSETPKFFNSDSQRRDETIKYINIKHSSLKWRNVCTYYFEHKGIDEETISYLKLKYNVDITEINK